MAAIPLPMMTLPITTLSSVSLFRLTTKSATADAAIAATRETITVGTSYKTGTGKWNASIPM